MMTDILMYVIAPVAAGFATWVFSMRKYRADSRNSEIENYEKMLDVCRKEIDSYSLLLDKYRKENQEREILTLERETSHMRTLRATNARIDSLTGILMEWFCGDGSCQNRNKNELEKKLNSENGKSIY